MSPHAKLYISKNVDGGIKKIILGFQCVPLNPNLDLNLISAYLVLISLHFTLHVKFEEKVAQGTYLFFLELLEINHEEKFALPKLLKTYLASTKYKLSQKNDITNKNKKTRKIT